MTESESTGLAVVVAALDGLPSRADAVVGGEVARMGLAREHHALELGVGEEPVGHHAFAAASGGRTAPGCGTAAMAPDCTSGVGCSIASGIRTTLGRHVS